MQNFEQYQLCSALTCIFQTFTEKWIVYKSRQPVPNESRLVVTEDFYILKEV